MFSRRILLAIAAGFALGTSVARADDLPSRIDPPQADPTPADLAKPGPAGDMALGAETAPVTIIEYASMTCTHCAHFAVTTFPELKKRYIDTGKVRYILREFPFDALSEAGFMLARCAGKDKYFTVVETLFAKQSEWVVKKPRRSAQERGQAFRLHRRFIRQMPRQSEDAGRYRSGQLSRRRSIRRAFDADLLRQRQKDHRRSIDRCAGRGDRGRAEEVEALPDFGVRH